MAIRKALVIGSDTWTEIPAADSLSVGAGIVSAAATWEIGSPGDAITLHGDVEFDGAVSVPDGFTDLMLSAQPAGGGLRRLYVGDSGAGLNATDLVLQGGHGGVGSADAGGDVLLVPGAPVAPATAYGVVKFGSAAATGDATGYEIRADTGAGTLPGVRYNDAASGTGAKTWQKLQGTGSWAPLGNVAPRRLRVGLGDDVEYTSIAAAITAAISGGAGPTTPWEINVRPGTYTEPAMSIPPGIVLSADHANRVDEVFVVASNPAADLFTCTGGYICGLNISGVTDPAYALIRCATAGTLTVLHGVSFRNCSNGLVVSNGASAILTNFSINLTAAGQAVTRGVYVTGSGSYVGISGMFLSVPLALTALYSDNPIQTGIEASSGADLLCSSAICKVAPKTGAATVPDVFLIEGGATATILSTCVSDSGTGARIGASGSNSVFVIQGGAFQGNVWNGWCDSATGAFFVMAKAFEFKFNNPAAGHLTGVIQLTSDNTTHLAGNLDYTFTTGRDANLGDFFADNISTGVCEGGEVTPVSGLNVAVAAGEGWIVRQPPTHDSATVEWDAVATLALTASATNYVVYDFSGGIQKQTGAPGNEQVLLQTVVTDGSGIRFMHDTRTLLSDPQSRIQTYLYSTIKSCLKSGLGVAQGSTVVKLDVSGGAYYLGLTDITYAGSGGDATWSYFYGSNGASEVSSVTSIDTTNYDASGTLTAMTAGYFRSDTVYLTSDGRISIVYGTQQYATQAGAEAVGLNAVPTFIYPSSISLCKVIVQQGSGIASLIDVRPTLTGGTTGGSGGSSTVHSTLLGLPAPADDHTQYLLCSGTRAMSGDLQMGGYDITNADTINGVTITAHASRHNPGGADALSVGLPVAVQIGAAPAQGTGSSYALNDHQHGIGAGVPGTITFGAAAGGSASTVARSDHAHALTAPGAPANVTKAAASAGTSANVAREDHKHDVTTAAAGTITFGAASEGSATSLSRSDHGHALTAPGAPANVTKAAASAGTSANVAREDHKHDVTTAAPSIGIGAGNSEGSATSLARSDHGHALRETSGPTDLTIGAISDAQALFRSGTTVAGAAKLTIDAAGYALLGDATTTPSAPAASVTVFSRFRAGRHMAAQVGPNGLDYAFQPALFSNKIGWWTAQGNSTTVSFINLGNSASGTATLRTVATTSFFNSLRRVGYRSSIAVGSSAGTRHNYGQFWRGNSPGNGGFFYCARFGISETQSGYRWLVGLCATTGAFANANPSTFLNVVGIGMDTADTTIQFMFNDGAGTCTKTDTGLPRPTAGSEVYEVRIFCPSNGSTIYWSIQNLLPTSSALVEGDTGGSTNIPGSTTLLGSQMWINNAATGGAVAIDVISQYIETDV